MDTEKLKERLGVLVDGVYQPTPEHSERYWIIFELAGLFSAFRTEARILAGDPEKISEENYWALDVLQVSGDFEDFCALYSSICKRNASDPQKLYKLSCMFFYNEEASVPRFKLELENVIPKPELDSLLAKLQKNRIAPT